MSNSICIFVLAGESNILGEASLTQFTELVTDFEDGFVEFEDEVVGGFAERNDAFVTFRREYGNIRETLTDRLSPDRFGRTATAIGPEGPFGFRIADEFEQDIIIVKAGGVSSLVDRWNAPDGEFYGLMIEDIQDTIVRANSIAGTVEQDVEVCGMVWW